MARYGSKRCSCCGERGHNSRTCPSDKAQRRREYKRETAEFYGKPANSRICSQCGQPGHNVKTCPEAKELKSLAKSVMLRQAAVLAKILNKIGLQPGALVQGKMVLRLKDSHGWSDGKTEHPEPILLMFQGINWDRFRPVTQGNIEEFGADRPWCRPPLLVFRPVSPNPEVIREDGKYVNINDHVPCGVSLLTHIYKSWKEWHNTVSTHTLCRLVQAQGTIVDLDALKRLIAELRESVKETGGDSYYLNQIEETERSGFENYSVVSPVYDNENKLDENAKKLLTSDLHCEMIKIERRKKQKWSREHLESMSALADELEALEKGN